MKIKVFLDLKKPQEKYLNIRYEISLDKKDNQKALSLCFPVWTPGSYLVREFGRNVEDFQAFGKGQKKLKWKKLNKSEWQIQAQNQSKITVTYKLYANDLSVRGTYSDSEFVFTNTPSAFFYIKGALETSFEFTCQLPGGWKTAVAKPARKKTYSFKNFDEFYDTPFLFGKDISTTGFSIGKTKFTIAAIGYFDHSLEKIAKDLKPILQSQIKIFGDHPCKHYVFQIVFGKNTYGGLEHSHSSTNMFDGFVLKDRKKYHRFISLLAHEHFHLWNVKRIRPVALGPFDYSQEAYTKELWIAEGITSFYDEHTTWRGRAYEPKEYLDALSEQVGQFERQHSSQTNSLSDSSFDAWIRFYRRNENTINRTVSYYLKGGLVMLLLDLEILKATRQKHSLDDVMRKLYQDYKKNPERGITREEFFDVVETFTKKSTKAFVRDYIDGTKAIRWDQVFRSLGLEWKDKSDSKVHFSGLILKDQSSKSYVQAIHENSPSFYSDLQVGDEVLAINDLRFTEAAELKFFEKQPKWRVLYSRRGEIQQAQFALDRDQSFRKTLVLSPKASAGQRKMLERFLRRKLTQKDLSCLK